MNSKRQYHPNKIKDDRNDPIRFSTIDIIALTFYYRIKLSSFGHSDRPFRIMILATLLHTSRIPSFITFEEFNSDLNRECAKLTQ